MSKTSERRVKILASEEEQARPGGVGAQAARGASSNHWRSFAGLTRHRCVGEDFNGQLCTIIFPQSAYQLVVDHLSEDTSREHGGFLLGYEIYSNGPEPPTVIIAQAVPARDTEGTPTRLTFTKPTWRCLDEITEKYQELGHDLRRVGWYHSHPNIPIFLSSYDLDVCTIFERRQYPVALVVDPVKKCGGFFVRGEEGYPDKPQGFYELHDIAPESVVKWVNVSRVAAANLVKPPEPVPPGALERPPLRIDSPNPRAKEERAVFSRIVFSIIFFTMIGALGLLTLNEQSSARRVDGLLSNEQRSTRRVNELSSEVTRLRGELKVLQDKNIKPITPATTLAAAPVASPDQARLDFNVDPSNGVVRAGQQITFRIIGAGGANLHAHWSKNGEGTINSQTGIYKAPSKILKQSTARIFAKIKKESRSAAVTLMPEETGNSKDQDGGSDTTVVHFRGSEKKPAGPKGQTPAGPATKTGGQTPPNNSDESQNPVPNLTVPQSPTPGGSNLPAVSNASPKVQSEPPKNGDAAAQSQTSGNGGDAAHPASAHPASAAPNPSPSPEGERRDPAAPQKQDQANTTTPKP